MLLRELSCQACGVLFTAKRSDAKWCANCKVDAHERTAKQFEARRRHPCPDCGIVVSRSSVRCRPCSQPIRAAQITGAKSPKWKGGRAESQGYIYLLVAPEKRKGHRYRAEHIVVWEHSHKKPLPKGWVVRHLNGIGNDNRPENLVAMSRSKHMDEHGAQRIRELEAELAALRAKLNGNPSP